MEQTLVIIKPDGVERGFIGGIVSRFEKTGLKVKALKMMQPSEDLLNKHYPDDKKWLKKVGEKTLKVYKDYNIDPLEKLGTSDSLKIGKMTKKWIIDYMKRGPMVVMILSGYHAVDNVRKLAGYTYPVGADVGSIRGDFCLDSPVYANLEKRAVENLVHASESKKDAQKEISMWFSKEEIFSR